MQGVDGEQEAGQAEEDAEELAAACIQAHLSPKLHSEKKTGSIQRNRHNDA